MDSNEYFRKMCEALKANKNNIQAAYRSFDNFWKDFEFGMKDFPYDGPKLRAFYYTELKKEWDAKAIVQEVKQPAKVSPGIDKSDDPARQLFLACQAVQHAFAHLTPMELGERAEAALDLVDRALEAATESIKKDRECNRQPLNKFAARESIPRASHPYRRLER